MKYIITSAALAAVVLFVSGCTTLHTAAAKGNIKAIDRLVSEGNDVNALDDSGQTPLIQAINLNQQGSVHSLLKSGANVNTVDSVLGNTPLHHAILQGNSKLVALLLAYKADITLQNYEKKTSLDLARESNRENIIRLIEDAHQKGLTETVPRIPEQKIELLQVKKDPEPLKIESAKEADIKPLPVVAQDVVVKTPEIPSVSIPADAAVTLKGMMSRQETRGIRNYLDQYPQAIGAIGDSKQRLRYLGPSGWRVIDIVENIDHKKMSEKSIIDHLQTNNIFYKKFTQEEITILLRYGFSHKLINTMMQVD